jgi:hypothetical protein
MGPLIDRAVDAASNHAFELAALLGRDPVRWRMLVMVRSLGFQTAGSAPGSSAMPFGTTCMGARDFWAPAMWT